MATFRSIFSRRIFAATVFCVSFTSMGAAFAPLSPSFQVSPDLLRLGPSLEPKTVSGSMEAKSLSRRDAALSRLEEMVLTRRVISTSA